MTKSNISSSKTELDGQKQYLDGTEPQNNLQNPCKLINTQISSASEEIINALEPILQAPDKKQRTRAIEEAAEILGKSNRTIRRMLASIAHEGVATLIKGRQDKGQYRISKQWRDFITKLYKWGQKDGSRQNISQVYSALIALSAQGEKLRAEMKKKDSYAKLLKTYPEVLEDLIAGKYPSHPTVYKIVRDELDRKQKSKARHPGADIDHQVVQTIEENLFITHSNQIWQADHTLLDVFVLESISKEEPSAKQNVILDSNGKPIRPFLTIVIDSFSGCLMGYYLGFVAADSHRVALALRNAILPKQVKEKFSLQNEWESYGIPEYLVTDRAKEFKSNHAKLIAMQLDFQWKLRAFPSAGGLVETVFNQCNNEVLKNLPGYTGKNVEERDENVENHVCMTFEQLEREIVQYFVDHYNQHEYPKVKFDAQFKILSRIQRWEKGLIISAKVINERTLDICLLKQEHRKVQKYGTIQFENMIYIGDCLRDYIGETISLRYDPRNIVTLLAYTTSNNGKESEFIGVIKSRYFDYEQMTYDELKWIVRKLNQQRKDADNISILTERYNHLNFVAQKRYEKRKQRRKEQQKRDRETNQSTIIEIFPQNAPETDSERVVEETQTTAKIREKSQSRGNCQSPTSQSNPRVRRRSYGIVDNIQDWNEYKKNNW